MGENDLLYEAARSYQELFDYKINLVIGRKGQKEIVTIIFDETHFHHLAGLHKLKDINQIYKQQAKIVYRNILKKQITIEHILPSSFFSQIEDRLIIVSRLLTILKNKSNVFKFRRIIIPNSSINWKILLEFDYTNEDTGYLFLDEYRRSPGNFVCVSDFKKIYNQDYGAGQIKYTLLEIQAEKNNIVDIWYTSPSYKK